MVAEEQRAWHAGLPSWAGESDINSASIGIEIQNPGHELGYPEFPEPQLVALEALSRDIIARHGIRARARAGPFRRGADAQEGPRREVSLGAPGQAAASAIG